VPNGIRGLAGTAFDGTSERQHAARVLDSNARLIEQRQCTRGRFPRSGDISSGDKRNHLLMERSDEHRGRDQCDVARLHACVRIHASARLLAKNRGDRQPAHGLTAAAADDLEFGSLSDAVE